MAGVAETAPLSPGKARGLSTASTDGGIFTVLAIDHRDSLRVVLDPADPGSVEPTTITDLKLELDQAKINETSYFEIVRNAEEALDVVRLHAEGFKQSIDALVRAKFKTAEKIDNLTQAVDKFEHELNAALDRGRVRQIAASREGLADGGVPPQPGLLRRLGQQRLDVRRHHVGQQRGANRPMGDGQIRAQRRGETVDRAEPDIGQRDSAEQRG